MKSRNWLVASAVLLNIVSFATGADAQVGRGGGDRWEQLGCVDVGRRPDRDIIQVGRREGRFKAIVLRVIGNDVRVEDLRVVYANGQPDDILVRAELREGSQTQPLDLQGRERSINRIEIVSQRNVSGPGRGRARICIAGLAAERVAAPARWERLGCVDVGRRPDRDIIPVGRREGRFKAIMVQVAGNDVRIEDLRVVYANGQPDDILVRADFKEGSQSQPLDLQGRERSIQRIEIVSQRNVAGPGRGRARICVSGLSDDGPRRW